MMLVIEKMFEYSCMPTISMLQMNAMEIKISEAFAKDLVAASAEIQGAIKNSTNPHFKSQYADLESVIDAVKGPLNKHNLTFFQLTHPGADAIVETVVIHTSGESLSFGTVNIPVDKRSPHAYGSALAYARRYGLGTALGVPAVDDDGNAAVRREPKKEVLPEDVSKYKIKSKCSLAGMTLAAIKADTGLWQALIKVTQDELLFDRLELLDQAAITKFAPELFGFNVEGENDE